MMKTMRIGLAVLVALAWGVGAWGEVYHYYFGNTHSHSYSSDGLIDPSSEHYRKAKAAGFDFYAVTDHALAKYPRFTPESYEETKRAADEYTDARFVGICGFEFSENDGPGGTGHLTALNTIGYLDATGKSVNLPAFYDWIGSGQRTMVAAAFNHPSPASHNGFDYLTPARRDAVTMYEIINSKNLHYEGFLAALKKGWRVAPIAGLDNHGTWAITRHEYRTGVLARSLTRENVMAAMRARRVYATWDKNLRLSFSANGHMMGSVLSHPRRLSFHVYVHDPDVKDAKDRVTRVEIVGDGALVMAKDFSSHTVTWNPSCDAKCAYYFMRVYCADKTDGPTAYSSPIWIESAAGGLVTREK